MPPSKRRRKRAEKPPRGRQEGRTLGTETTINHPYEFGVGRLLNAANWKALITLGHDINDRLLKAQLKACDCAADPTTLQRVVSPSIEDGQKAPPCASATPA